MAAALRLDCEVCEEQAGFDTTQIESWNSDVKRRPRILFCSGDMAVLHDGTAPVDTLRTPVLATRSPAQMATRTRQHAIIIYGAIQFEDTLLGQRALQLGSLPARSRC